ncbi:hypothetical protein BDD12DRAFT_45054 [Trichophaea hybrida]|nr:hypothetical protein BDD12DRAFT_45054 [Trichophaea hybrida]
MADKNIKEGDEVSWKWGGGAPSGVVKEIKTEGKLEIESKGKLVHKNADPSNPAVHVAREGNDVVKRASELTKENSAESEKSKGNKGDQGSEENKENKSNDDKLNQTAGTKRDRVDTPAENDADKPVQTEQQTEQKKAEKETGKEAKKAKLDEEATNG